MATAPRLHPGAFRVATTFEVQEGFDAAAKSLRHFSGIIQVVAKSQIVRGQAPLFDEPSGACPGIDEMAEGAKLLRGFANPAADGLMNALQQVASAAPFRHMTTPGGYRMSVAMTNCGPYGWVSDAKGYRYAATDPATGLAWPPMPEAFQNLATNAAAAAGFAGFHPDACLINRYEPGAKLSLHQDKDERDFTAPIVSVSLGLPAIFLFGGLRRPDPVRRYYLESGDIAVWGGPARLTYHGVSPLADGEHTLTGRCRINLTFRYAMGVPSTPPV